MRKVLLYPFILIIGILLCLPSSAQDINYSQYFSTPMYYNPAFTGLNTGLRARFTYRDQWPTLPVDLKSYYFSADVGDRNLPGAGGIGLMIQSDNYGYALISNLQVGLTVGVRVPITSFMIAQVGIKAAVAQNIINWDELVFSNQLDPRYGVIYQSGYPAPDDNRRVYPDFAAGGILQFISPDGGINGNIGLACDHIFRPDKAFLSNASCPLERKWVAHGDVVISSGFSSSSFYRAADEPLKVNIGFLYQNQAKFNSLNLGLNLLKYNMYLGGWYKTTMTGNTGAAVVLLAGYRYRFAQDMSVKFIYSYDLQVSKNLSGTGGAHEISIVLDFDQFSLFGGVGSRSSGFIPGGGRRGYSSMECPTFY